MSRTVTLTAISQPPASSSVERPAESHHVQWAPDTVDNEHMGKRKSKKCCIFKKKREFGESSSESDDSDTDHHCVHRK